MAAYVLQTYGMQSDENIRKYVSPDPAYLRQWARFLEVNRLNVFSAPRTDPSKLNRLDSQTLFQIETVNGMRLSKQSYPIIINSTINETLTINGWALDELARDGASEVFVTIDGQIDIPTYYGLDRLDISTRFNDPNFRYSGFMATFSIATLERGTHTISIKIVTIDGMSYYAPEQEVSFVLV
jgi:hypothetical protein